MLPFVPSTARCILDVGCGRGGFGYALRESDPTRTIWAVESETDFAATASAHYDEMVVGVFPEALSTDPSPPRFDCIVFNDVLEHQVDPWETLRTTKQLLTADGTVVASIPNVRNLRTVFDLAVRGDWTYVEMGVLDRTHLRFFTRRTTVALFEDSGYEVEALAGINALGRSRLPIARALPVVRRVKR